MTIVRPRGKDHYGLLGVWPSASPTVIEAAYDRALQLCEGDPEAKRRTKEAYRVLTNARARAQYDARIEAYTWASVAAAQPTLESEVIETREKVAKRRRLGPVVGSAFVAGVILFTGAVLGHDGGRPATFDAFSPQVERSSAAISPW